MERPKVIILNDALEYLSTYELACRALGSTVAAEAVQHAREALETLTQYDVSVMCAARVIRDGDLRQPCTATAIQQEIENRTRAMLQQIGEFAHQEGLIDVVTDRVPPDTDWRAGDGTRITVRCAFLRKAEPKLHLPEGGEQG